MDFSYYDDKNVKRTLNLQVGSKWSEIETGNESLNSIFNKIDVKFERGNTGDRWLLASIIAIGNTPKGKEILDKTVKVNDNGSVTVTLQGVNKTYTISEKELVVNNQLSTGDLDVRAIELAEIIETRRQEYEVRNKYATAASVFSEAALLLCLATIPAGRLASGIGTAVTGVASLTSLAIKAHYDNLNDETIRASLDVYQ